VKIADEANPTEIPIKKTPANDKCFPSFESDSMKKVVLINDAIIIEYAILLKTNHDPKL